METVSLRELRGAHLRDTARSGKLLAITNHRALVAVVVPLAAPWVEHLVGNNLSQLRQSIAKGEQAVASAERMVTLGDVTARAAEPSIPERIVIPLATAHGMMRPVKGKDVVDELRALAVLGAGEASPPSGSAVVSVRIGDLTAKLIEQVSQAGQIISLTHERELIGLVVPITPGLVEYLIERSLSRVVYNVVLGEKELSRTGKLDTLDDVISRKRKGDL
jgi:antitoxin (DNA-binding transcriptional repressor) of toxin-antitoxin stability system